MTFVCEWARDLNNTYPTFNNGRLMSSSSVSWLSEGRLLENISTLHVDIVNYLKSVRMTFGSLSIACLWSMLMSHT